MSFKLLVFAVVMGQVAFCLGDHVEDLKAFYRSLPRVDFSVANANSTDVIYILFTNSSPTIGKEVTEESCNSLIQSKDIPTVLIMHGWTTDDTSPWYRPLRDEYFKQGPHNILFLNWSKAGNKSYQVSCANVKPVGMHIAQFLITSKVNLSKVHLVGHSLGAQLSSYIGKSITKLTGKNIGRITGLDPAGPMFSHPDMLASERLNCFDADLVDVIHTDVQLSGFTAPTGHVDFYPNEGKHQPGCPSREEDDNCSHARSTLFFIESIFTKISAKEAIFNEDDKLVVTVIPKKNGKEVIFGQHVDKNARGVYYFKTNPTKPFLS